MRFEDKIAIVTGAANGIGRATVEIMLREGGLVVAVDLDPGRLEALRNEIGHGSENLHLWAMNVLDAVAVDALVADVMRRFGRVDILVNGVGGSTAIARPAAKTSELTLDDWHRLINFNLDGTFLLCRAVGPIMERQGSGKIVNMASLAGRGISQTTSSAYAAAKGGIIAFTKKLSLELGPSGVNVNAIAPSFTLTERLLPQWEGRAADEQAAEIARTPLRRMAKAVDQARVICFLASPDADFVTGLTIDVTGGL